MENSFFIEASQLQQLFEVLHRRGYAIKGPTLRQGDLVYDEVRSPGDLPQGWLDEQEAGVFRLVQGESPAFFGCGVGQHSWKQFLFLPNLRLWQAKREGGGWQVAEFVDEEPPYAFLGVRACDLAALEVHDRTFARGRYADPIYQARRQRGFIVAVNCTRCGGTCFCASLGNGPQATFGFDLALTEVVEGNSHYFVVQVGTDRGQEVLETLTHRPATPDEAATAERLVAEAARSQKRTLDTQGLKEFLYNNYENPHWDRVVERCLTCGNCAITCPTCFCHNVDDRVDVTGEVAERWREWEVCFSVDHSYIHGGAIRPSPRSRYRQWLTHKLATWVDQYGCLGCIGCGRCITWCPVGIDITQEVRWLKEAAAESETSKTGEKAHGNR